MSALDPMSTKLVSGSSSQSPRLFVRSEAGCLPAISQTKQSIPVSKDGSPYRLLGRLGSGGMASVFLASRPGGKADDPKLYAIKRMHPDFAGESDFERMFLDEARLASYLDHPNLVGVHEIGEDDGVPYIVLDYVEGDTLDALAPEGIRRAPASVAIAIVLDILEALDYAHHARGPDGAPLRLVHRDVAPSNVLVGVDGRARLIDFGIARTEARLAETLSGQRKGRLDYMAPEQLTDSGELDLRADVFSVGTLLWTALVGRPLFRGDHDPQTMERLLHMTVPPPSRYRPELPGSLDAIVARALERDRNARFRDAGAMARALRRSALASELWAERRQVGAFVRDRAGDTLARRSELLESYGLTASVDASIADSSAPEVARPKRSARSRDDGHLPSSESSSRRFASQVVEFFSPSPVAQRVGK